MRIFGGVILAALVGAALGGCGQTGPLYHPPTEQQSTPQQEPAEQP